MARTLFLTTIALLGFAANSILCRLALGSGAIDAYCFTTIRLFSGALTLILIMVLREQSLMGKCKGDWRSALMLFAYAAAFSFAYNSLETGTGALILFGAVQVTMILADYVSGNRLSPGQWAGLLCSFAGFIVLILPGVSAPSIAGFLLMATAGCAWGFYTLMGRGSTNTLADTTGNFVKSLPITSLLLLAGLFHLELSLNGILLAVISGAFATGIIYVVWYSALQGLSTVNASVVQLLVPVIAAYGGVIFMSEEISGRLIVSSVMILGGILAVMLARKYGSKKRAKPV